MEHPESESVPVPAQPTPWILTVSRDPKLVSAAAAPEGTAVIRCAALVDATQTPPLITDWGALVTCNSKKSGGSENKGYITLQCTKATVNVEVQWLNTLFSSKVLTKELNPTVLNTNLSCSRWLGKKVKELQKPVASKLSPAGVTRGKRKHTMEGASEIEAVKKALEPELGWDPPPKKAKKSEEKKKESDEEVVSTTPVAPPTQKAQKRLNVNDYLDLEAIVEGAEPDSEENESDEEDSQTWSEVESVSQVIKRKQKDVSSSQATTPAARRRLSRQAKLEKSLAQEGEEFERLAQKHRLVDLATVPVSILSKPTEPPLLIRPTDPDFVQTLAERMLSNPVAVVAPWLCVVFCEEDDLAQYRSRNGAYDLAKLANKHEIWVVGGNHSYEALKRLQVEFPMKKVFQTTKISLWWWPTIEDRQNITEMETLAAHHNVDQEIRKKWEFVDKLSFIRRKYVRQGDKWTKEASESVRSALGMKTVSSVSPLLQLVQGSKEKFDLVLKIATANQKTIKSESKFKCLQGEVTEKQQIELLQRVAQGSMTLDEMNSAAEEIKLDVKIKRAAAYLLKLQDFEEVEKEYGLQAFSVQRRRTFFPAFKQQQQRHRHSRASGQPEAKQPKKKGEKAAMEVPEQFSAYVEQVRQRGHQVKKLLMSEAIEIGSATHEVFQMDVKDIAHICARRAKYNATLVILDPPYGLGVAPWDVAPLSVEELNEVLSGINYVNSSQHFHLVIFCEWKMYAKYEEVLVTMYGERLRHSGPLICLKPVFGKGTDLPNAADLALYARIGTPETYLAASPTATNVIPAAEKKINWVNSIGGKPVNPAQKPLSVIKTIVQLYAKPGGLVMDLFCGTGQVAKASVELDISTVSIDKNPEQIALLQTWLHLRKSGNIPEVTEYQTCYVCEALMTPTEEVVTCNKCGKQLHKKCAMPENSQGEIFCSGLCRERL